MTPDEYRLEQKLEELGWNEEPSEPDEDYEYDKYMDEKILRGDEE